MNDITIRFLDVYEWLKSKGFVSNPKGFASEIEVSTSLITEICKKRTNAGITPIQNLINRFPQINSNWLLTGKGDMIKSEANHRTSQNIEGDSNIMSGNDTSITGDCKQQLELLQIQLEEKKKEIEWLKALTDDLVRKPKKNKKSKE
jgi:hypothetical protein